MDEEKGEFLNDGRMEKTKEYFMTQFYSYIDEYIKSKNKGYNRINQVMDMEGFSSLNIQEHQVHQRNLKQKLLV